ncbi:MAG: hypothetical protein GTO18_01315 [Anaerolineales bacterium]|nr:hypothetical protein [Anaerolineales bacterium]
MSNDVIKDTLRRMPYGFYAITSRSDDDVNAMVANWVSQISFEPRLVSLALQTTSYTYGLIEKGKVFAINLFLKEDDESIKPFTKGRSKNPDKMVDAEFETAPITGCPVLAGSAAYLECKVIKTIETGGDHNIVIGEVVGAGNNKPAEVKDTLTLTDIGWSYAG